MLGGESQQGGHSQGDPGRNGLRLDPETDPGHDDDQTGGDVGVEQVVAQPSLEHEHHLQACEVACREKLNHLEHYASRLTFIWLTVRSLNLVITGE